MSQQNGVPTQVYLVSGKAANRAFREAKRPLPPVPKEEADLSQKARNVDTGHPQQNKPEET
jgi:hypothetical protein